MDADVVTSVDQLLEEVAEIRKLGKAWGFEDDEITECLSEALDAVNLPPAPAKKALNHWGKFRKCLRYGFLTLLVFMAAIFLFITVLSLFDDKSVMFITKHLMVMAYPLFRYSRLMFLPIHGMFNVTDYYNAECLVNNPWFDDSPDSCWHCRYKKTIHEKSPKSSASWHVWKEELEVAVYRSSMSADLNYSSLQEMFRTKKDILQNELRSMTLSSNRPNVVTLVDVFEKSEEEIVRDKGFHFRWRTSHSLATNRILRQLFGRPSFVGSDREISFDKIVIIQAPDASPHQLGEHPFPHAWYVQVSGTRDLKIKPLGNCDGKCKSFDVTLHPKDAVVYIPQSWQVELLPHQSNEISVGYMGSFA